jgi:general secretion pathway protein D
MLGKVDAAAVTDNKFQSLREIDLHLREKLGLPDNGEDRSIDNLFSPR